MRTTKDIERLLDRLDNVIADELESQDLDFKQWDTKSRRHAVAVAIEMAVCMANGGGGTVVFGVNDRVTGRRQAISGVPYEIDVARLQRSIYDSTDPKITPVVDELQVPEGTGRLLVMHVYPGLPPYTDVQGRAKIRVGKDCLPLTGTLRRKIAVETGEGDYTRELVAGSPQEHLSASALEELRAIARREHAPEDLLALSDADLLELLGLVRDARLTRAGALVAGNEKALRTALPSYVWTHLRMSSDTEYDNRADGSEAFPLALRRLFDHVAADNPITTIREGIVHFEHRRFPEIAIREALVNAFCHADFRLGGPILVKQSGERLEIGNPGGFIGGITAENILHHRPVARNPCLVDALVRLRIVNRSNLGVPRMYRALLIEGKEPPRIVENGDSVTVTFRTSRFSLPVRLFVDDEARLGRQVSVDQLLIIHYLLRHAAIGVAAAARICQRNADEIFDVLDEMQAAAGYLDRQGSGPEAMWHLSGELMLRLAASTDTDDWRTAKALVLKALRERSERGEPGLANSEIREMVALDRNQVYRLMHELRQEVPRLELAGAGRWARYRYRLPED